MKVKCTANTGFVLPKELLNEESGYDKNTTFQITIGKEYVVYAITHIKKNAWFLICDDSSFGNYGGIYPNYLPAIFFQITDPQLSKFWIVTFASDNYNENENVISIAFPELLEDEYFLGNLWEEAEKEKEIFLKYKNSMDNEFLK